MLVISIVDDSLQVTLIVTHLELLLKYVIFFEIAMVV
jgi:hypothetical protein